MISENEEDSCKVDYESDGSVYEVQMVNYKDRVKSIKDIKKVTPRVIARQSQYFYGEEKSVNKGKDLHVKVVK